MILILILFPKITNRYVFIKLKITSNKWTITTPSEINANVLIDPEGIIESINI